MGITLKFSVIGIGSGNHTRHHYQTQNQGQNAFEHMYFSFQIGYILSVYHAFPAETSIDPRKVYSPTRFMTLFLGIFFQTILSNPSTAVKTGFRDSPQQEKAPPG
jgi:hypothetical protein